MQPEYFQQYCQLKQQGLRKKARKPLLAFIASFQSVEEKIAWTQNYVEKKLS